MENSTLYLIQSGICLAGFYIIYRLFLKKETFFMLNRFFLLGSVLVSLFIPLFDFSFPETAAGPVYGLVLKPITISENNISELYENNFSVIQILSSLYALGFTFFLMRFIIRLIRISVLIRNSKMIQKQGLTILESNEGQSAFSFLRFLFVDPKIKSNEMESIIAHEMVHIRQLHSVDILFIELVSIFQWFNPVIWYYYQSMKEVHEFLADDGVIKQGIQRQNYLILLLNTVTGNRANELVHTFNHSPIKNRIVMMTKPKSASTAQLKLLLALPLIAIFVLAFACNNEQKPIGKPAQTIETPAVIQADTENEEVYTVVENPPVFSGGNEQMSQFLVKNIKYPDNAREKGIQGKVFVSFVVDKTGKVTKAEVIRSANPELDAEALRVVSIMPDWTPGKQGGEIVSVQMTVPISFKLN
jgi:TonB family protein